MSKVDKNALKSDLKTLILAECDKEDEFDIADISDDEALIGSEAALELDSLDTLQMSLAIQRDYGVRIEGAKDGRVAFASINALADYIVSRK